jgi:curved DNA-binding protein
MAVKYQDYYDTLGISRDASQEDIQKAYRKLARTYHPDVNKSKEAEDRFKQVNEAYEVLKDPEKRRKYDALGDNWQNGQDFTPPPGWEDLFGGGGGARTGRSTRGFSFDGFDDLGFSDFFDSLFGGFGGLGGFGRESRTSARAKPGQDQEAELTITLEEAYRGGRKSITLEGGDGVSGRRKKNLEVTIPPGVTDGRRLRLSGQGQPGPGGSQSGDLYLRIRIAPHRRFRVNGKDLEVDVPVAPWEAALGGKIQVPLVEGAANVTIPAGIQSGKRIRVKGKGLRAKDGAGDIYAVITIAVPRQLSGREKELFDELARVSNFNPRA